MIPRVIADRFELLDRIGKGAMGEVWSATDLTTRKHVAVKLAQMWSVGEPELMERFEREGKLLKRMKSKFICQVFDQGRINGELPYIVMEMLDGETLEQLLKREGYLALDEVGKIADEVLQALIVAHNAGIVHRDLSPANVFLHRAGDDETITKLLDFGIAKTGDNSAPKTAQRATMGSLPFVAPEQLGDSAKATARADLYALGTIVFYALTGQLPYGNVKGTSLVVMKREHDPPTIDEATGERWPAALKTFLAKTIARAPAKRYASAEVALASLREAMRGKKGPALDVPDKSSDATPTLTLDDRSPRRGRT